MGPEDPRHGTHHGYATHGCRCDRCRDAQRLYMAAYRAANRERHRAQVRKWKAANPDKVAAQRRRQAACRAAESSPVRG